MSAVDPRHDQHATASAAHLLYHFGQMVAFRLLRLRTAPRANATGTWLRGPSFDRRRRVIRSVRHDRSAASLILDFFARTAMAFVAAAEGSRLR